MGDEARALGHGNWSSDGPGVSDEASTLSYGNWSALGRKRRGEDVSSDADGGGRSAGVLVGCLDKDEAAEEGNDDSREIHFA